MRFSGAKAGVCGEIPSFAGFTLVELLVVAVISAVLLLVAVPEYREHLLRTHRAAARIAMYEILARQEQYFIDHQQYADSLLALGYPASPFALDSEGHASTPLAAPERVYLIEISVQGSNFTLHAQPQLAQTADAGCGVLSLTSQGVRASSGRYPLTRCW